MPSAALLQANAALIKARAAQRPATQACGATHREKANDSRRPWRSSDAWPKIVPVHPEERLEPKIERAVDSVRLAVQPRLVRALVAQRRCAVGRVWLLLRHLDEQGCGWVEVSAARQALTANGSTLRLVGWRRLRQLLSEGDGLFWRRGAERIWLKSPARVAAQVGVDHFGRKRVAIPLKALLGSIQQVRAHFYATIHSARDNKAPISRQTLQRLTSLSTRTQQRYDQVANVARQPNYVLLTTDSAEMRETFAYEHGRAVFRWHDKRHNHLQLARQIGNSYRVAAHQPATRGRTTKANRTLRDLVKKRAQGNTQPIPIRCRYLFSAEKLTKMLKDGHAILLPVGQPGCWQQLP